MVKAILFDRDGVIVDSASTHINSVVKTFEGLGIKITEGEKLSVVSKHPKDYVKNFLKKYNFKEEEFLKEQQRLYLELFTNESLLIFGKMISIIKSLNEKGIRLGLVTSSDTKTTNIVLEKAGLENIFNSIVTASECESQKPNPEPYLMAINKLNLSPEDCIAIEDSSTGLESAKRAGMRCIVIPTKYTKNHDFSLADYKINKPEKILSILESIS